MELVPLAFNARLKDCTPTFTVSPARFVFVLQRMTVFIGRQREGTALVSWSAGREDRVYTSFFPYVSKGSSLLFLRFAPWFFHA